MRTWSINDTQITCLYEYVNYCGSLTYDFATGELHGHKPENVSNLEWFKLVKGFFAICHRMLDTEVS